MNTFKINIIDTVFKHYDKFYLKILPSAKLIIGRRGLIGDEVQNGIILIFGPYSYKDFKWDSTIIDVKMKFSGKWENIVIPLSSISAVFDDLSDPSFLISFKGVGNDIEGEDKVKVVSRNALGVKDKVVKLEFKKKDK